jgi:hypothetical protein
VLAVGHTLQSLSCFRLLWRYRAVRRPLRVHSCECKRDGVSSVRVVRATRLRRATVPWSSAAPSLQERDMPDEHISIHFSCLQGLHKPGESGGREDRRGSADAASWCLVRLRSASRPPPVGHCSNCSAIATERSFPCSPQASTRARRSSGTTCSTPPSRARAGTPGTSGTRSSSSPRTGACRRRTGRAARFRATMPSTTSTSRRSRPRKSCGRRAGRADARATADRSPATYYILHVTQELLATYGMHGRDATANCDFKHTLF